MEKEGVCCVEMKKTWMDPFLEYFKRDVVSNEATQARKLMREAFKYTLVDEHLYRRGFSFLLLKFLDTEKAEYVMQEVHEGLCESHIGGRALASKVARASYYWSTLKHDCLEYVKKCDTWQRCVDVYKFLLEQLHSIMSPWSVHKQGVDILGPFPITAGHIKYLIVVVDYFTKWVEAEPVATISAERVKRFYWNRLICRFRLPTVIVSNNGTQFASWSVVEFYSQLKIQQSFTSIEHPQSNGQEKVANKVILRGLRRRLEEAKGRWVEELP
ncbi:Gypsy retrotransposon integrase-like protein 1, partial [Mucuna pruriens]